MQLIRLQTILVATDLLETSDAALATTAILARAAGAAVHVVHVAPDGEAVAARTGIRSEIMMAFGESLKRQIGRTLDVARAFRHPARTRSSARGACSKPPVAAFG